jgi:hypothetical protein
MAKIKQSNLNTEQCSKKESVLEKSSYAVTCKTRHTKTSLEKSKRSLSIIR